MAPLHSLFTEGTKIEASYRGKGKYYAGKIARDNKDGTYDVDYDDSEKETKVEEKLIRLLGGVPTTPAVAIRLAEGNKIEANYHGNGKYYPGKIARDNKDGTYDVDYDDGEKETRVEEKLIRLVTHIELGDEVEAAYKGIGNLPNHLLHLLCPFFTSHHH